MSATCSPAGAATRAELEERLRRLLEAQRANRWRVAGTGAGERIAKLERLASAIAARRDEIRAAAWADFGKPATEAELTEVHAMLAEIRHATRHLRRWMRPRRVPAPLLLFGTRSEVRSEPRGVVLIIAPWNYAFSLVVAPLVAAIAAGNCAVLKPSEKAPNTSALLARFIPELFDEAEVAVVEGGVEAAETLVSLPFDHVFFTGGAAIGRRVMAAAAENLASVTLELGGKSPAIVDGSADVRAAARRIVWGKFVNAGQTCVAPDYVLVHAPRRDEFLAEVSRAVAAAYGESDDERARTPDLCRVVDGAALSRLRQVLEGSLAAGARLVTGGQSDADRRYFAPTVVAEVPFDSPLMIGEIFGPILPVLAYTDLDEALARARALGKPLALYVFSRDEEMIERVLRTTTAGGTVVNNVLLHYANPNLPFGGVGTSGSGSYHGVHGFRAFSHSRAVVYQREPAFVGLFSPPYRGRLHSLALRLLRLLE